MSCNDKDLYTIRSFEQLGDVGSIFESVLYYSFDYQRPTAVHFGAALILANDFQDYNSMIDYQNDNTNIHNAYQYLEQDNTHTIKVLFDTGALCANYISQSLYEDIKHKIGEVNIIKANSRIYMADDTMPVISDTKVQLKLKIYSNNDTYQLYERNFVVIKMKSNDIIIGLPAILTRLWDFFKNVLESRRPDNKSNEQESTNNQGLHQCDPQERSNLMDPLQYTSYEEAPEEKDVQLPVQFEFASSFLSKSRDEAIQEYYEMFDDHIAPDLLSKQILFKF